MLYKLESLRGWAACMVVLYHCPFRVFDNSLPLFSNGYLFVDFFFILSGFVMNLAYCGKIQQGFGFGRYLWLRLGRLYPLHLFTLLIWLPYVLIKQQLFLGGFGGTEQFDTNNLASFLSNLVLLHSLGLHDYLSWNIVSWSISTELFAYLVFYGLMVSLDRRAGVWLPIIIVMACYGFLISLGRDDFNITYDYGAVRCVGAFYLGVFLSRWQLRHRFYVASKMVASLVEVGLIVGVMVALVYARHQPTNFIYCLLLFCVVIHVFAGHSNGVVSWLLDSKVCRKIGLWSYSIYMLHALVVAAAINIAQFVVRYDLNTGMGWLSPLINTGLLLITIGLAGLSYRYIESYFRDLSRTARFAQPSRTA